MRLVLINDKNIEGKRKRKDKRAAREIRKIMEFIHYLLIYVNQPSQILDKSKYWDKLRLLFAMFYLFISL